MPRKLPRLPNVKWVRAHGRDYAYFNTGKKKDGRPVYARLPDPAAPQFHATYASYLAARNRQAAVQYTVGEMAHEFEKSAAFAAKAANTRRLYALQLKKIRHFWGSFPVDSLTPANVREVLESAGWKSGTQNTVIATLGTLYTWGRKNAKTSGEPTKDIERPKGGSHDPWPDDILNAGLAAEDETIRLAVHLLYFTGVRIGDAVRLRWGDVRDGEIVVTPEKTKRFEKTLHIPLAGELETTLAQAPRKGMRILHGLTHYQLRERLQAFTRQLGVETVPHGLRKNAVNSLLLAGCSIAEVAAITGQTYQIVEHYAAKINRRRLAGAAILKLDQDRSNKAGK